MRITEEDIRKLIEKKESLREKFYEIFQEKYIKPLINQPILKGSLDGHFELCYNRTREFRAKEMKLEESWLKRNKAIRELYSFLKDNEIIKITLEGGGGKKIKIESTLALEIGILLEKKYSTSDAHNYRAKTIREETARNSIILSLRPFYDFLSSEIFPGKGGKETACSIIVRTLEIMGYRWPDKRGSRRPEDIIRQLFQPSRG